LELCRLKGWVNENIDKKGVYNSPYDFNDNGRNAYLYKVNRNSIYILILTIKHLDLIESLLEVTTNTNNTLFLKLFCSSDLLNSEDELYNKN
jgi:hypothetical protein